MPTYIVFVVNVPPDAPPPDPATTWAVLTQQDTSDAAVEYIVGLGALPPTGEVHACDVAATESFNVSTAVTVDPVPEVTPYFAGEPMPMTAPVVPPAGPPLPETNGGA